MNHSQQFLEEHGFLVISLPYGPTTVNSQSHKKSNQVDINNSPFQCSQETYNTYWSINCHISSKGHDTSYIKNIIAYFYDYLNSISPTPKTFYLKCLRAYTQRTGFFMKFHHDSKTSKNSTDIKDDGYILLTPLLSDDKLGFEIIPGSHLWDICNFKSSFNTSEIKKYLYQSNSATKIIHLKFGDALIFNSKLIHRDPPYFKHQLKLLKSSQRSMLFCQYSTSSLNLENILLDTNISEYPFVSRNLIPSVTSFPSSTINTLSTRSLLSYIFSITARLPFAFIKSSKRWFKILFVEKL